MAPRQPYRADPRILELGPDFYDAVEPARFPKGIPRFLNKRWAESVGLVDVDWEAHFHRFEPLPDNLTQPLALRYHGHQFRTYNPEIGDGRGAPDAGPDADERRAGHRALRHASVGCLRRRSDEGGLRPGPAVGHGHSKPLVVRRAHDRGL